MLRRVHALPSAVTDVRGLLSGFYQVLAVHTVSREHLGHPVGERETAAASPCLSVWEDRLRSTMLASLVNRLESPLVPRVRLGSF